MQLRVIIALGVCILGLRAGVRGEDWPQFRGPGGAGLTGETQLPTEWSADKHLQWKAKIPGRGWSSPVVWGDKVFVTAAGSEQDTRQAGRGGGGRGGRGFGGGGPGGFGRGGGFGGGPALGQVLPSFLQDQLNLTAEQKSKVDELQKEVDGKLEKILNDEQTKQFKDMRARGGPGGFGGRGGGFGGGGGFGRGGSPPDAVYHWDVYCLDRATGNVLWKQRALEGKPRIPTQASNTYATETPITDGERVYAYFGMHGLFCYDTAGKLIWKKDLGAYSMQMGQGTGSSPVLDGERLFLQIDNEEQSFLTALDRKTGQELWRVSRSEGTNYSTPFVWKNKERTELVTAGGRRARAYDPATGKVLWELSLGSGRCTASPVGDSERLYIGQGGGPGGFGGRGGGGGGRGGGGGGTLYAVKVGATGDITPTSGKTSTGVAWSQPNAAPAMASPLVYQGNVYIIQQNGGLVSCYDARTGKAAYTRERIPGARSFWASPCAADGKIFCLDDGGTTHILQAGPKFQVLGKNTIEDQFWASPAVAAGALILRGVDYVYCIK